MHYVVNDLHVLVWLILLNCLWSNGITCCQTALIGVIVRLIRLHVYLVELLAAILSVVKTLI